MLLALQYSRRRPPTSFAGKPSPCLCRSSVLGLYPSVPKDFKFVVSDNVLQDGMVVPVSSKFLCAREEWGRSTRTD